MSLKIDLILENIALEIITGGVSTANVMISSGKLWPKCLCTRLFDFIKVYLYLILSNMALEIITGGNCNANVTISMGEMITTCHSINPINIMSYNIGLFLEKNGVGKYNGRCFYS